MTNSVCRNNITPLPENASKISTLIKFQRILKLSSISRSSSKAKSKHSHKHGRVRFQEDFDCLNELLQKWAFPYNSRRSYYYGDHDWECWVRFQVLVTEEKCTWLFYHINTCVKIINH